MIGMKSVFAARWRDRWSGRAQASSVRPSGRLPRLFVDVSVIIRDDARTGIQRVVRAVYTQLLARSGEIYNVVPVFASRSHGYRAARPDFLSRPSIDGIKGAALVVEPGDKFLGLDLCAHLLPKHEKEMADWRQRGVTTHIVVYDLLPLLRPQWFNEKTVRNFKRWLETIRDHCDQALCISDAVANELQSHLETGASKPLIGRLRLAGDLEGSLPSRGIDAAARAVISRVHERPTVLMVGTIEPRKAYDVALAAFERLWRSDDPNAPALVIAGKPGWRTEALQDRLQTHPEQGRRLFWLTSASDEGLAALYNCCSGVFLASHAEGFGLPAIEAAMHGRNALVRDLPVFREQRLDNLSYFSTDDPIELAAAVLRLVNKPAPPASDTNLPCWATCVADLLGELSHSTVTPLRHSVA